MDIYLNGIVMPKFGDEGFMENSNPNAPLNVTLDGTMWVDFINRRRGWTILWDTISLADYNIIKNIYNNQFTRSSFVSFYVPKLNISTAVFMTITQPIDMKWGGQYVKGFTMQLDEQFAIS